MHALFRGPYIWCYVYVRVFDSLFISLFREGFLSQRTSNAENFSISWGNHVQILNYSTVHHHMISRSYVSTDVSQRLPFSWKHFQTQFVEFKCLYFGSHCTTFVLGDSIVSKSSLNQVMACRLTYNLPLPETLFIKISYAVPRSRWFDSKPLLTQ